MHRKSLPRTSLPVGKDCPIPPLIAYRVDNIGNNLIVDLLCCGGFSVNLIEFVFGSIGIGIGGVLWFDDGVVICWTDGPCTWCFIFPNTVVVGIISVGKE